jgi:trimethylamine:corrinoid methyltransferase-like protein
LKILQQIGTRVLSKKVQSLLAENGAEVDSAHSIANIPSSLVERAKEKVREILSKHSPPQIDGDVRAEIDQIVCDYEKSIL